MKILNSFVLKPGCLSGGIIALIIMMFFAGGTAWAARVAGEKENVTTTTATTDAPKEMIKGSPAKMVEPVKQDVPSVKQEEKEFKTQDAAPMPETIKDGKRPFEPAKKEASKKYVTIDFDNVDIGVLVKFVSELTGKNFIIDDKVKGKVTVISPKKIPVEDVYKVFLSVLEVNGFAVVPAGNMTKIIPASSAREKSLETRIKNEPGAAEDRMITQIVSLERANPDEVKRVLDPIISKSSSVLSYPPAGILVITDYLSNIKRLQEIISALDVEGAGDQISYIPLQNASASEVVKSLGTVFQQRQGRATAIKVVADSRTNSIILLASVADTEVVRKLVAMMDKDVPRGESNIQVYRLQNSIAEDLAKVLNSIKDSGSTASAAGSTAVAQKVVIPVISKNVQVVPDKATNTLVIMAEREDYKVLENIIKQLDVPRAMVYIEALIMEVNANKAFNLGVEWRGLMDTGKISGSDMTGQSAAFIGSGGAGTTSNPGAYNILGGLTNTAFPSGFSMGIVGAGITIGGILFPNIGAVVQAYKTDSEVSILSTPQIMTLDNEEAEINVGSNVPYITRQDSSSTTTTNTVNYNTYEYKDVGVILNITPHINEENFIRLKISQQVTKVTSGTDKGTPTTLKRTAKTTVVVKDKDTIVIGGLVGDSTQDNTYKVPLFGDIPLLGWLFKTNSTSREKTNLYVFLTPHIVRTQKDAAELYQGKRETMGEVVEGIIKLNDKSSEANPLYAPAPAKNKIPANP
ncbi:MAG: type II secretion system protein GspD [Deltaproteobacteria bacterium HGW-Deltaproteobacteria-13]|jgi:general secretion pathway protein D|nr:MAG: type II secretion system protein GspD [Deltaproteobacteria bacterium HGW-Deltaproteobacteria-13]